MKIIKKWWFWVIVGIFIILAIPAIGIFIIINDLNSHYVSYADETAIINEAVSKNDMSICTKLPADMYGDSISHPSQVCEDMVNYSRAVNAGQRACSNLGNSRVMFDCLVQVAHNTNNISICQQVSSVYGYAASYSEECITEFNTICKQNPQDFQGCRANTSGHDW